MKITDIQIANRTCAPEKFEHFDVFPFVWKNLSRYFKSFWINFCFFNFNFCIGKEIHYEFSAQQCKIVYAWKKVSLKVYILI